MTRTIFAAAIGVLCAAGVARAGVWSEVGEAVDLLPGQLAVGSGSLDTITGTMDFSGDADMYKILITSPMTFSATTVNAATSIDTRLYLFDSTGHGVTYNDDAVGTSLSQSTITNLFVSTPGVYYLAISTFDTHPVDLGALNIWQGAPFRSERAPDGPGASGTLGGWSRDNTADADVYEIDLTGVTFVPEPATGLLVGLAALAWARRRGTRRGAA